MQSFVYLACINLSHTGRTRLGTWDPALRGLLPVLVLLVLVLVTVLVRVPMAAVTSSKVMASR